MTAPALDLQLDDGDRVVARVALFRVIDADGGMRDEVVHDDGAGEDLDLITAVGMLAFAQHIVLTGSVCDDE